MGKDGTFSLTGLGVGPARLIVLDGRYNTITEMSLTLPLSEGEELVIPLP